MYFEKSLQLTKIINSELHNDAKVRNIGNEFRDLASSLDDFESSSFFFKEQIIQAAKNRIISSLLSDKPSEYLYDNYPIINHLKRNIGNRVLPEFIKEFISDVVQEYIMELWVVNGTMPADIFQYIYDDIYNYYISYDESDDNNGFGKQLIAYLFRVYVFYCNADYIDTAWKLLICIEPWFDDDQRPKYLREEKQRWDEFFAQQEKIVSGEVINTKYKVNEYLETFTDCLESIVKILQKTNKKGLLNPFIDFKFQFIVERYPESYLRVNKLKELLDDDDIDYNKCKGLIAKMIQITGSETKGLIQILTSEFQPIDMKHLDNLHGMIHTDRNPAQTDIKTCRNRFYTYKDRLSESGRERLEEAILARENAQGISDIVNISNKIAKEFYGFSFSSIFKDLELQVTEDDDTWDQGYYGETKVVQSVVDCIKGNLPKHSNDKNAKYEGTYHQGEITLKFSNHFNLENLISLNKSLRIYEQMNSYGFMSISSGKKVWLSYRPHDLEDICENITGHVIKLKFKIPDSEV